MSSTRQPRVIRTSSSRMLAWALSLAVAVNGSPTFGFTVALAAVASIFDCVRRARGDERLQLTWFAYGGVLIGVVVAAISGVVTSGAIPSALATILHLTSFAMPVTIGIAIPRYRLHEIDLRYEDQRLSRLVLGSRRGDAASSEHDRDVLQRSADSVSEAPALAAHLGFRPLPRSQHARRL